MKICYLGNAAEIHTQRWARHFAGLGYQVTVVSFEPAEIEGVQVFSLPALSSQRHLNILLNLVKIRRLVKKIAPDILHAHYVTSYGLAGAICGIRPYVATAWGCDVFTSPEQSILYRLMVKWVLGRADLVTSMADHMTAFMNMRGYSEPERILTLPFGVNTGEFHPRFRLPRQEDATFMVLSTRKLDQVYDVETFVRAMPLVIKRYPSVRFVIVGEGPLRQSLEKLSVKLDVSNNITFMGNVPYGDMPRLLGKCDVFVTASLSDGNNISLNEAMACGAFPVVSDIPANREWVVDGQNGLVFPCGNFERLAEKIILALQQPELRRDAASKNWSIIEQRGSWSKNMDRMDKYYRSKVVVKDG